MGLSSNVLWHQTRKDAFFKILEKNQLKYAYSLESVISPEGGKQIAFPMISMCNLPLSEFTGYLSKYGGYSLGLKQSWGKKNGFAPVWYCDDTSEIRKTLVSYLRAKDPTGYVNSLLIRIFAYIKLTEDELLNHNYISYRFADEREVRSVPTVDKLKAKGLKFILPDYDYNKYKTSNGDSTIDISLDFKMSDLRYLIVPTDEDVKEVHQFFMDKSMALMIPILTHQQITDDFIGQDHNKRSSIVNTLTDEELLQAAKKHLLSADKNIIEQLKLLLE